MAESSDCEQVLLKQNISSCFMHFEGIKETVFPITRQRLETFLSCRPRWSKLDCAQAEIARKSYDMFTDEAVWSYLEKDTNFSLNWHYHKGCYKKICDKEKIRREEAKLIKDTTRISIVEETSGVEENQNHAIHKTYVTRKLTRSQVCEDSGSSLPKKSKHVLPEECIICGKDNNLFTKDKVSLCGCRSNCNIGSHQ